MQTYYISNKKEALKAGLWLMCIILGFTSCKKEDDLPENLVSYYYEETYCADPWENNNSSSDAALQTIVSDYLSISLGVKFYRLRITDEGTPQACFACSCKTGKIIRIEADLANEKRLVEAGFKKD